MSHASILQDIVLLLAAGVLFVPLFQKLGLGSVLGYLLAGIVIGPFGTGLIFETTNMKQVSEMGVVFLLFIIGLELEPKRLWEWRTQIFGMGTLLVFIVTLLAGGAAKLFGQSDASALILGLAAAMSSTAIASQVLADRNLLKTHGGSSAFSILLFQDMAVIPILALLPLLAGVKQDQAVAPWKILLALIAVVLAGQFFLRHVLRLVASARLREVFTALSLLLVLGMAALMENLGVSMALGAFIAGVLLAGSEYRHAIESDIEPFKGLLLGLFFMSVGMSVDIPLILVKPHVILLFVAGALTIKIGAHMFLARMFGMQKREVPLFALLLSQIGEFAFVLLGVAAGLELLNAEVVALASASIAISMASTPLLLAVYDRFLSPHLKQKKDMSGEEIHDDSPQVIIAGFGRVGQIIGRILYANRIRATVLDHDPDQIELLRRFGFKVYYGDATRLDLMEAAGARKAKIIVVAVDDMGDSLQIVDMVQENFPHLKIVARARNVNHVYELLARNVQLWERETFESSLRMSTEVLKLLGWEPYRTVRAANKFRTHNVKLIHEMFLMRDNQTALTSAVKQSREDLEKMFAGEHRVDEEEEGWEIHPDGR